MSQAGSVYSSNTPVPGTLVYRYTLVNTTPYVVLNSDEFLGVDTTTLAITIQLPNAPTIGRVFIVKDIADNARVNNITIRSVSGTVNIDGATSYVMNTDLEAVTVLFNGTEYLIF